MANETFTVNQTTVLTTGFDADNDGVIDPGERVTTTVTIQNNSNGATPVDATGVAFTETLSGMTLVDQTGDDINVSPIAFNDGYNAVGNTPLTVNAANGLLSGASAIHETNHADVEFFSQVLGTGANDSKVVTGTFATAQGGSVTISADGSFTYTPAVGFTGTGATADTFTYTVRDAGLDNTFGNTDDLTSTATVSIDVGPRVWYIDNTAAINGSGTKDSPFNSIANFNAVNNGVGTNHPAAGDTIYLAQGSGTYTTPDGFNLLNGQTVIGAGEALTVTPTGGGPAITIYPAGTSPLVKVTGAGNEGVELAHDNTLKGFNIETAGDATTDGIADANGTVGTLTISNMSITGTGQAIDIDQGGALNVTLASVSSTATDEAGINLSGVTGTALTGSFAANGGSISLTSGHGVVLGTSGTNDTGGTFSFSYSGSITTGAASSAVIVAERDASAGNVTFSGNITAGSTTASAIVLNSNESGNINFTGQTLALTTTSGAGINATGNTGTTVNFNPAAGGNGLDISTTTGTGFVATGGGTFSVTGTGNSVAASAGQAINIDTITVGAGGINFDSTTSTNSTAAGVAIASATGGAIALGTGSISGSDGDAFRVGDGAGTANTGGTSAITYAGSISKTDGTGQAVDIQDRAAGAGNITLSGNITHNVAANTGILLDDNAAGTITFSGSSKSITSTTATAVNLTDNAGATIDFTNGGLVISTTTGTGFNATGPGPLATTGGTVTVTGSGNTITAGNGTGLAVVNTTIGANDLTFQKITSSGGSATGIILDNTGTAGGLHVTGTGAAGTGGTIASKTGTDGQTGTGIGIYLNNTSEAEFAWMQLNDLQNFGIRGNNVTGFKFDNSVISGSNGNAAGAFDEAAISFNNLLGTASISNGNITNGFEYILKVLNSSGTLTRLTIDNTDFGTNSTTLGGDAVQISASNTATANVTVTNSGFTNAREDLFNAVATQTANMDVVFRDNTLSNNHTNKVSAASNILVFSTSTGTVTYDISHNTLTTGATGSAIAAAKGVPDTGSGGTMTGTINANTIGVAGVVGSGSQFTGIFASALGSGTHTTAITNNTIRHYNEEGIFLKANDNLTGGNSVLNATVTGNITTEPDSLAFAGLWVVAGSGSGTENNVVNVVIGNISTAAVAGSPTGSLQNDFTNGDPANGTDVFLQESGSNSVINLSRAGSAAGTGAGVVQDDNVGTPAVVVSGTVNLVNTLPPTPPPVAPLLAGEGGVYAARSEFSGLVDDTWYYANNPDVAASGVDAAEHYALFGWHEGRNPNAYFDTKYYLAHNPDVAAAGVNPLQHYLEFGAAEGRNPSAQFDTEAYLAANPDVAAAGVNPLEHFLLFGQFEGRSPLGNTTSSSPSAPAGETPLGDAVPPQEDAGTPPADTASPAPTTTAHPVIVNDGVLTQAELDFIVDAAIVRWAAAGLTDAQVAALQALHFNVADAGGQALGTFAPGHVTIDNDAAGWGWFLDGTPFDDSEFGNVLALTRARTDPTGAPAGHYDLLTTVMHEMGHALGLADTYAQGDNDELMFGWLYLGERRVAGAGDADGAIAGSITSEEFLIGPVNIGVLPAGQTVTLQWQATIDAQNNKLITNPVNTGTASADNAVGFPDQNSNTVTTTLDTLILGGTIWNDNGAGGGIAGNGIKDGTEAGVSGVLVSLFVDANNDDVPDTPGTPLVTGVLTNGSGDYSFTGLAPGNYIVRVDQDNFDAGGNTSLFTPNLQVSPVTSPEPPDPDDNVDNDDNGARVIGQPAFSKAITLAYNTEPTPGTGNDTNNTLDFGFLANQPPTAANVGPFSGAEDATAPLRIAVTLSGTDPDAGDAVDSFTLATLAANGSLFAAATGGAALAAGAVIPASGPGPYTAVVYFQPNADWSGSTSFTYTAFDGVQSSASATASLTVTATSDVSVTAADVIGVETDATVTVPLSISVTVGDVDGSETLTNVVVDFTGAPAGMTAAVGVLVDNGGGSYTLTLTPAQVATASVTVPADYAGNFNATVVATTNEGNSVGTSVDDAFTVTVNATAEPVTANDVSGTETDATVNIPLALSVHVDADGSETLTNVVVDFTGAPAGLTAPTGILVDNGGGSYTLTLTPAEVAAASITVPADYSGLINGSAVANSNEGASAADPFTVTVNASGDASVTANDVSGAETDATVTVALSLSTLIDDVDGSETLTNVVVDFTGAPAGMTAAVGVLVDNGGGSYTLTLTPAEVATASVTVPADYSGLINGSAVANSNEGASAADPFTVTVSATPEAVTANDVSGTETDATVNIPLALSVHVDADGSETLTDVVVDFTGAPAGLTAPTGVLVDNGGGSFTLTLTPAQVAGASITVPADYSGLINGSAVANSNEGASPADPFTVTVNASGDVAVTANDVAGTETDAPVTVALSLSTLIDDVDGSETLTSVVIDFTGAPAGLTATVGVLVDNGGGSFTLTLTPAQVATASVTVPADYSGSFTGSAVANSNEGTSAADGFNVSVAASGDVSVTANDVSGTETNAAVTIPLSLSTLVDDVDGSETLTNVVIDFTGAPAGMTAAVGSLVDNGGGSYTLTLTPAQVATASVTVPADYFGSFTGSAVANSNEGSSAADVFNVTVTATNDPPAIANVDAAGSYNENAGPLTLDTPALIVPSDIDNANLASGTITIGGFVAGDILEFPNLGTPASAGASYNATTGVLTITAVDTLSHYQDVLRGITFRSTSDNPTNFGANPTRTLTYVITDQDGAPSTPQQLLLTVNASNDAPTVTSVATSVSYATGGSPATLSSATVVADVDNQNLATATVTITDFQAGDVLAVNGFTSPHNGISWSYNGAGVLSFTTSGAVADFQALLRAVQYSSTAPDPTNGGANITRHVQWVVNDGSDPNASPPVTTVNLNAPPELDLNGPGVGQNGAGSYTENDPPLAIVDTNATVSDDNDTQLQSARIVLTNAQAGDVLTVGDLSSFGISSTIDTSVPGQITVTLNGASLVANYQAALKQIFFSNPSDDPSTVARNIEISVNDGGLDSNTAISAISFVSLNDAPVNTLPGTLNVEANHTLAIAGLDVADSDAGGAAIITSLSVTHGTLAVGALGGVGVSGSGTTTVTLTGSVAQIHTALSGAGNVVYTPTHDFFGADSLTMTTNDQGNTGNLGPLLDTDVATINVNTLVTGTPGPDDFTALPGNERIDALTGVDTVTFGFRLVDATVTYQGNKIIIDGPAGSHTLLTGVERFVFTDGTVDNNDGSPLIDDLFYYSRYHDVWNAHVDADAHFNTFGWHENRDPSAFFSTNIYLSSNPDVRAAGVNPLTHFDTIGWTEARIPSLAFDPAQYLAANPDVAASHVDPLRHYLTFGYQEGRLPFAPTELVTANGFDFVYYLAHNPDVAAAGVDPFQHFQTVGWHEGRNPDAFFDIAGYLSTYADVAASGVNPLDHYNQFGWHEGRDPSVGFDTTSYLAAYADVAAAGVNPLVHYLHFGIHEGRSTFADGTWG